MTRWDGPLTVARPPSRRRQRLPLVEAAPMWIVLAVCAWLVLALTIAYLWSFV